MAVPQLNDGSVVEALNMLRREGRVLRNELAAAKLRRELNAVLNSDASAYYVYMGSLHCLKGDLDLMHGSIENSLKLSSSVQLLAYNVQTLLVAGVFSEAACLFSRISDDDVVANELATQCSLAVLDFERGAMTDYHAEVSKACLVALSKRGLTGQDILPMLDLAGDVLRKRGLIRSCDLRFYPYENDGTLTIHLPVKASSLEVAELEWEYSGRLFSELPSAQSSFVHVGFCSDAS